MSTIEEAAAAAVNEHGDRQPFVFDGIEHINHPGCARGACLCRVKSRRSGSDLDAIVERSSNIIAKRELADLRRIERAARALVASWERGPEDLGAGKSGYELESAVKSALYPSR